MMAAALHRPHAGFTLIELMTVIAVLGLVAALAAPSFREFTARSKLRGVANEAYTDLQFARAEAVQRNARVRVDYSATGYSVVLDSDNSAIKSVTLPSGTSVASGSTLVATFDPVRATAAVANGPAVLAAAGTSGQIRLNVNAWGRPEICAPSTTPVTGVPTCP
jgi:type II secretion system protein H